MIQIAICDDDPEMRRQLSHYTTLLMQKHMDFVRIDTFSSGKDLLDHLPPNWISSFWTLIWETATG